MNDDGRHSSVFSVVSAPKVARKFDLTDIPRLVSFVLPSGGNWDREFQRYLALGDHSWFIPRSAASPIQVFCYQENGSIPWEMVAKRCSIANVKSAPIIDHVKGIRVRRPQIAGALAPSARNLAPAHLSIPVSNQNDAGEAGFRGLLHRHGADGAVPPNRADTTILNRLRRAFRPSTAG